MNSNQDQNNKETSNEKTINPEDIKLDQQPIEIEEKYNDAINCYKKIKEDYPDSEIAKSVDKYINKLKYRNADK